jgi:hypothetical protein
MKAIGSNHSLMKARSNKLFRGISSYQVSNKRGHLKVEFIKFLNDLLVGAHLL